MDSLKKMAFELVFIPILLLFNLAFAWLPMLAWNHGVHVAFPNTPEIGYWTAYWLSMGLGYLTTKPVTLK